MPSMFARVIASLLALVLLWSGVSTIEVPRAFAPTSPEQQHATAPADGRSAGYLEGSVDDHHLDDIPSQAQSDSPPETPGLLSAPVTGRFLDGLLAQPRTLASVASAPPFLAGPLRPPCRTTFAG